MVRALLVISALAFPNAFGLTWNLLSVWRNGQISDDDGQPQFVYINPQTGTIGGLRLASQRKGWRWAGISLGLALLALVIGLVSFAASPVLPPLSLLGFLACAAALALGIFAIIPAVWPWQWNRQQRSPKIVRS